MRECEVKGAGVEDQRLSNISVQIDRSLSKGVNNMVISVDSDGVLWGRDQEFPAHSVSGCLEAHRA